MKTDVNLTGLEVFDEIWCADFEFHPRDGVVGNPQEVVCLAAHEMRSGQMIRLWRNELGSQPPYRTDAGVLFVAYAAQAELSCHIALGWPMPERILDLLVEQRNRRNGLGQIGGFSLPRTLAAYDLDGITVEDKKEMIDLILSRGPWSDEQKVAILDYCQSDADALARLLPMMLPHIDLPRALLRGEYIPAVATMEHTGIPVDVASLARIERNREAVKDRLIAEIDRDYGVYDGRTFKRKRFEEWVHEHDISWPVTESGELSLRNETFKEMEKSYRELVGPLRQLRAFMSETKAVRIAVGADGRARTSLWPFGSKTARNQPKGFLFGLPAWYRSLIKPQEGWGLAYLDYEQQEFAIAAALSKDRRMMEAYASGDPYMAFARQAGAVPADATKATHGKERDKFKACALGVLFGKTEVSLARDIGCIPLEAKELLKSHREAYPDFWRWSEASVQYAVLRGKLHTVFGWNVHVRPNFNPRSLMNHPMQANGAEMLRIACTMITSAGIRICAPVHDAILIEAPLDVLDDHIRQAQDLMAQASREVLDGFAVRTDAKVVRYPDRYMDQRGEKMWHTMMKLSDELEAQKCLTSDTPIEGQVPTGCAGSSLLSL